MQERDTKWTPMKALGKAQKEIDALGLPNFKKLEAREDLHFPNISNSDNKELEEFLDQLNTKQFKDVQKFFDTMPKLQHKVSIKNPKTKKTSEVTLSGLNDFFS